MNNSEILTYIAKGTQITADIHSEQDIHLSGEVHGDIVCTKKFVLTPSGVLNGTIKAETADISGEVDGEIRVNGSLSIQAGSKIKGHIFAKKLEVHSGAQIKGNLQTGPDVNVEKTIKPETKSDIVLPEKDTTTKETQRHHADVLLSVNDKKATDKQLENLRNAVSAVMETLDFKLDIFGDEEKKPYFQNFVFVKNTERSRQEITGQFRQVQDCLKASFLKKKGEPFPNDLYEACVTLSNTLKAFGQYSVKLGEVMILKYKDSSGETMITEMVPTGMNEALKKNPKLIQSPHKMAGELQD